MGGCHERCFDGAWDSWQEWQPCSVSCGGGTTFRNRKILKMANSCGLEPQGKDRETTTCNVKISCEESRDCEFGSWNKWSDCSSSCLGVKKRERQIIQYGRGNGAYCRGPLKENLPCNPASSEDLPEGCGKGPISDCLLAIWGEWSSCTKTCGGGQHRRSREIVQHPENGGRGCSDTLKEITECAINPCSDNDPVDCAYGDWDDWGQCGKCDGERKRIRHIRSYAANGGRACGSFEAEQVGRCPRHCHEQLFCSWQDWHEWSPCTTSCGTGGKRHRLRQLHLSDAPPQDDDRGTANPGFEQQSAVLQRYDALYRQTRELEVNHLQEIIFAFAGGCLALLAGLGSLRVFTRLNSWNGPESSGYTQSGTGGIGAGEAQSRSPSQGLLVGPYDGLGEINETHVPFVSPAE